MILDHDITPDTILINARILTMDPARPRAEAVAFGDGYVLAVGTNEEIERLGAQEIIDCRGATVLPGFCESHLHLGLGGTELSHLQLGHVEGLDAITNAFRDFAAQHPDRPLLMGQGGHYAMLDHPMTRHDLDRVLPDRPIAIMAHDHHTVWANTAALKAADMLQGLKTPHGHEVVMEDGQATGELREFEAFAPIMALAGEARLNLGIATGEEPSPAPTEAERAADRAKFKAGLKYAAQHGVTSMVNMDGNRYTLELLAELQKTGDLTARVKVPFHFKPHMDISALDRAIEMTQDFDDEWLTCGFIKMFMDGVIDAGTAFMVDDYPGRPGHRSEPLFEPKFFKEICTLADKRGLQIAVHAIGDGAVRATINGYEAARTANGLRDSRHRIEHIELIQPGDIHRMSDLGITASIQPPHVPGAMDFGLLPTMEKIARARWKDAYVCNRLNEARVPLAFASDWPVTDISVLRGIGAAMTRKPYEGAKDERIGLMKTLHAYTAGGAWASHREQVTGMLTVGLGADAVILSRDLEAIAPEEIASVQVLRTIAGGKTTYVAS